MRTTRTRRAASFAAMAVLALAACGGSDDDDSGGADATETTVEGPTDTEPDDGDDAATGGPAADAFAAIGEELCTAVTDADIDAIVSVEIEPLFVADVLGRVTCQWFNVEGVDIAASYSISVDAPFDDVASTNVDFIEGAY